MADFVCFDPASGAVSEYRQSLDTPEYAGRPGYLQVARAEVEALQAKEPSPCRWLVDSGAVREMTAAEKASAQAAEDAAGVTAARAQASADASGRPMLGLLDMLLPLVNDYRQRRLLPAWTLADLVAAVKAKIGAA